MYIQQAASQTVVDRFLFAQQRKEGCLPNSVKMNAVHYALSYLERLALSSSDKNETDEGKEIYLLSIFFKKVHPSIASHE